jgi:UDP-N-acetylmuramyl pentapeptide phosphotransferase/UDP-N-acetylglucosamine-1-phosphate transferase
MTLFHIAFLVSFTTTGAVLAFLKSRGIVDEPNERSSHKLPTPRGGGLAVTLVILGAWGLSLGNALAAHYELFFATLFLGAISWIDDLRSISAWVRLLCQFVAVGLVFWLMPSSNMYFHGIVPLWLDNLLAVLLWIWFINLFNFMDGIDGISGVEASSIGFGIFFLMILGAVQLTLGLLGLVIAATALGFLWWNWQPAKIFLGDVGSVPLGFLLGWVLLEILATPAWIVSVILPLYYLADATVTLLHRGLRCERVWRAHREHFYQQATGRGLSHSRVSILIASANGLLIGLAIFSLSQPFLAIIGSFAVMVGLLAVLGGNKYRVIQ